MRFDPIDVFWHLIDPILFLLASTTYIPRTIFGLILDLQFRTLITPSLFKDAWFANFWKVQGPLTREGATPRVQPLISLARGVVIEIGAGSGEWLHLYDKSKVTKIYGVEPNKDHHAALRRRIKESGLEDVYVIVPVGVEDLGEKWVKRGDVDCVLTIQCLCSVPEPKRMIRELYGYLKQGGIWIVYEHVVAFGHQGRLIKWYQELINIVWPHFLGGCSITRDSGRWLKDAGSWSKVELRQPEDEMTYHVLPHVMGVLTK